METPEHLEEYYRRADEISSTIAGINKSKLTPYELEILSYGLEHCKNVDDIVALLLEDNQDYVPGEEGDVDDGELTEDDVIVTRYQRSFSSEKIAYLTKRDGGKCVYCGDKATEIDHVVPYCQGGPTITANAVCSCTECNRRKYSTMDIGFLTRGFYWLYLHHEDMAWLAYFIPYYTKHENQHLRAWASVTE